MSCSIAGGAHRIFAARNLAVRRLNGALLIVPTLLCVHLATPASAQTRESVPKVRVIGLGGTIAYVPEAGGGHSMKTVEEVVGSLPDLSRVARVETEQYANRVSTSYTPDDWLRIAQRVNRLFRERPDLSGIVITHGTATLEELAFFLYLTVRSDRPVVLVAAQRAPTLVSPDGPGNLLDGVRVAASPAARGKGVVVVMDDRIISARDVKKYYARIGGFQPGEMGMLGAIASDAVDFFYAPTRKHTATSDFDVSNLSSLPSVGISYSYSGAVGTAPAGAKAVVVSTTSFTPPERKYYEDLQRKGMIVAVAFPSGEDVNVLETSAAGMPPIIHVAHLTPTKARILLMLALTKTRSPSELQRLFDSY